MALLVFVLAACGGSAPGSADAPGTPSATATATRAAPSAEPSSEPTGLASADALEALKGAAQRSVDAGTVSIIFNLEFDGSTLIPNGTFMSGRGQASFGEPLQTVLDASFAAEQIGDLEMIVDDRLLYMRGDVLADVLPAGKWVKVDLDSNHPAAAPFTEFASGQNDTSLGLYYPYGAVGDVIVSDGEPIDGHATTRYDVTVDLAEARGEVPENVVEVLDANIAEMRAQGVEPVFDAIVWATDDGQVLRAIYVFTLGPTQGGGSMIATYDFRDYGAPIELGVPSDDDVVPVEELVPDEG